MRFMEWIRQKGGTCMAVFLIMFVITLFAGLTISGVSMRGCRFQPQQPESAQTGRAMLSQVESLANVVLTVNSRSVESRQFYERVSRMLDDFRGRGDDPAMQLYAYGYAAQSLIAEEVTFEKAEELDVRVTDEDMAEARNEVINQMLASETDTTGNVIGDIARQIGTRRERKAAFYDYLEISGLTEQQWNETARRELLIRNTREAWQELIDEEKALEAAETKALIDQRLADGESFAELAEEYSEDPSATSDPIPMGRNLVLEQQEEALFNTPVGELTEWIEIPAGWCRFEVTEVKLAEGEEFEAEREQIIENLKGDNEDYEPTDEEIKQQYERVSARQIMLKTTVPGAVEEKLQELIDDAQVRINEPYVLAFQALNENKLQPVDDFGYDKLVSVAQTAAIGEDYQFGLVREALERGGAELGPVEAEPAAPGGETTDGDTEAGPEDEAAALEEEAGQEGGEAESEEAEESEEGGLQIQPAEMAEEEEPTPLYPLAIGLFKLAIQDQVEKVGPFPYYMIGQVYMDWLADEDSQEQQPLDREQARLEAEDNFARASEGMDYSYFLHAERGLNLAWLERPDEALASLELAIKYAPQNYQLPIWEKVREAYEVLDDQEKLEEFNAMIDEFRQVELQRMIEQAQSSQEQQQQVISIPDDGEAAGEGEASEDGSAAENGEAAQAGEDDAATDDQAAADGGDTDGADEAGEAQPEENASSESGTAEDAVESS